MSQLFMRHPKLTNLPGPTTSEEYCIRKYEAGDEVEIAGIYNQGLGDGWTSERIMVEFVEKPSIGPNGIFVACKGDLVVGTASAWVRRDRYPDAGYLHMVGVAREQRGKGIGRAVSLSALLRFREVGFDQAVLHTDDFRRSALFLYLSLGFCPELLEEEHRDRWIRLCHDLGYEQLLPAIVSP